MKKSPSPQQLWERELKAKAQAGKKLRGQQTLTSAVSTSRRLSEFENPKLKKTLELMKSAFDTWVKTDPSFESQYVTSLIGTVVEKSPYGKGITGLKAFLADLHNAGYKDLVQWYKEQGSTLAIKGDKPKLARLARHLQKEHPSTKGKMALFDQDKKERLFSDIEKARKYAKKMGMKIHNTGDFYGYTSEINMKTPFLVKEQLYDPVKLVSGIPARWYEAMVNGIKKRSDVRNPYAIVKGIWARLPAHSHKDILAREKSGERFHYDLPLPDDRMTRGIGTLRMVRPFNLAEAQVNVNKKDFDAVKKSGIFRPMKREDGSTCMVARCKGIRPVNIFVDKV